MLKYSTTKNFSSRQEKEQNNNNNCKSLKFGFQTNNQNVIPSSKLRQNTVPRFNGNSPILQPKFDEIAERVKLNQNSGIKSCAKPLGSTDIIKIYTDWANHYLDKCHKPRRIGDLQKDLQDHSLLLDVIESVTGEKVSGLNAKPRNSSQAIENINCCLCHVTNLGVELEAITANEIACGHLKSILALFFALSRWKQQQKQQLTGLNNHPANDNNAIPTIVSRLPATSNSGLKMPNANSNNTRLPSPFKHSTAQNNSSSTNQIASPSRTIASNNGKTGVRPLAGNTTEPRSKLGAPKVPSSGLKAPNSSGLKPPGKLGSTRNLNPPGASKLPPSGNQNNPKMLEKFKLFGKEKDSPKPPADIGVAGNSATQKSTSNRSSITSSSGFSSSKSDMSDKPTAAPKNSGISSPKATFKAWANRGKSSGKTQENSAGSKLKGLGEGSTPLSNRKRSQAKEVPPPNIADLAGLPDAKKSAADKPDEDNDSAYAGCSSSSPSSSNAPSTDSRLYTPSTSKSSSGLSLSSDQNNANGNASKIGIAHKSMTKIGGGIPTSGTANITQPKPTVAVKGMAKPTSLTRPTKQVNSATPTLERAATTNISKLTHSNSRTFAAASATGLKAPGMVASPTVGIVSPMTHYAPRNVTIAPQVPQTSVPTPNPVDMGHQSDSNSSKSDTASVIFRPNSSRSSLSDASSGKETSARTSSRLETTFDSNHRIVTETTHSGDEIQPMAPLVPRASPFSYIKGSGRDNIKNAQAPSYMNNGIRSAAGEIAAGYVSEGDALTAALGPLAELGQPSSSSGYMSEGGISLYAKKMQARFREGHLQAVNDNISRNHDAMTDSFEDSSSLSSGLSENIDEISTDDLTGSSLSDHHTSAYNRIMRDHQQQQNHRFGKCQPKQYANSGVECGQQTEDKTSLYQRKLSQQENIDLLLQKCRTGSRGVAVSRPKSEALNNGQGSNAMNRNTSGTKMGIGESHESQRLAAQVPKLPINSSANNTRMFHKVPEEDHSMIERPGSAQGHSVPSRYTSLSGYHSLDRKRHLQGYLSESDMGLSSYGPMQMLPEDYASSATMAMVSPRRLPVKNLGVQQGLPPHGMQSPRTALRSSKQAGMSRSLIIERNMKLSPQDSESIDAEIQRPAPQSARLSLAPREYQNGRMSRSGRQEGIYSNLIQKTNGEVTSPTQGQQPLYLHRLSNDRTSSGHSNPTQGDGHNGGAHGSTLSLASTSSSIYASTSNANAEERYQAEIRKLHKEVEAYREKVSNLTAQQSTYTAMVQAFENTLQGMIQRCQALQNDSQRKDAEVTELRQKIDVLREMGHAAGINVEQIVRAGSPAIHRRHTFTDEQLKNGLQRQPSVESMVSTVSQRSSLSNSSKGSKNEKSNNSSPFERANKNNKKGWAADAFQIRSSFSRAFKGKKNGGKGCSMSDVEECAMSADERSLPASPAHCNAKRDSTPCRTDEMVEILKGELQEKDNKLTDVRLEALTTAEKVDELKEQLTRLRTENTSLKLNNERLSTIVQQVTSEELGGSHCSLPLIGEEHAELSDHGGHAMSDVGFVNRTNPHETRSYRRVLVSVCCDLRGRETPSDDHFILVGSLKISAKTTWNDMDSDVARLFNEYMHRIDPESNLNVNSDSLLGYNIGNVWRKKDCVVNDVMNSPSQCVRMVDAGSVQIVIKGTNQLCVDALAFETLMPKGNLERYIRQLQTERRLVICGSCGTGKTHVAHKLAHFMALTNKRDPQSDDSAIEVVELNDGDTVIKTTELLKQRLGSAFRRCQESCGPLVLILDNLNNVSALSDVFSALPCPKPGPYIISTMNQTTSVTSLQIGHSFRIVMWTNHTDPVKLFLKRYLRRRLVETECTLGSNKGSPDIIRVLDFLHRVWSHLNEFLTIVNSSDVTIGPRLFVACPMNMHESRLWFIDLWNRTIHPYITRAATEGLSVYGKRGSFEDPSDFVCENWPWSDGEIPEHQLLRLPPNKIMNHTKVDPMMALMRITEQAKRKELAGES